MHFILFLAYMLHTFPGESCFDGSPFWFSFSSSFGRGFYGPRCLSFCPINSVKAL